MPWGLRLCHGQVMSFQFPSPPGTHRDWLMGLLLGLSWLGERARGPVSSIAAATRACQCCCHFRRLNQRCDLAMTEEDRTVSQHIGSWSKGLTREKSNFQSFGIGGNVHHIGGIWGSPRTPSSAPGASLLSSAPQCPGKLTCTDGILALQLLPGLG